MQELKLTDLLDVKVLQQIQDGFSKYTGMAALTTDADGVPVTVGSGFHSFCTNLIRQSEEGRKRCEACDRKGALWALQNGKQEIYHCHAGLVDYAAPIMVEGQFIGSFIGGQTRISEDKEEVLKAARELGIDEALCLQALEEIPVIKEEEVERAAEFLTVIANVLSEMAYNNYVALKNSRKLERTARAQTAFILEMNADIQN